MLRDFRSDEVKEIDERLLDLLYAVQQRLETDQAFEIYSAYRTPETNALLRREGWGVARNSLHMQGMAIDVGLPGLSPGTLPIAPGPAARRCRLLRPIELRAFDVGEVRTWRG